MSEVKVNKISPRTNCGTVTLGDSGDTFTIPSGATITNAGTASGFGATGETSWDTTVKTTGTFTATAGVGYFLNTTGGTITVNLPAGAAGSSVALADYAATWNDNKVTVSPNGSEKIGGTSADVDLTTKGQSVTFVYIDGTQGWVNVLDSTSNVRGNEFVVATGGSITTSGNDKIHTFTGPGTFTVSCTGPCAANNLVSYMVVAGGGGGGGDYGAGAGAGGFRETKSPVTPYTASPLDGYSTPGNRITVSATAYPITVGGGGTKGTRDTSGTCGANSVFSTITSTGGGKGGMQVPGSPSTDNGFPGGSGGGARYGPSTIGSGNTPPVTPPQGNNGGAGHPTNTGGHSGGGGGGAGAVGQSAPACNDAGDGGNGVTTSISATPTAYAGGGGGAGGGAPFPQPYTAGTGGTGGGGAGAPDATPGTGTAGTVNTGGGGGGGNLANPTSCGGAGGSGIVIIRYKYQ